MMVEIIVEFPSSLTEKEKKMIYGYKGELVRCKDCKYGDIYDTCTVTDFTIKCTGHHYGGTYPENYCNYAERRGDE